LHTRRIDRPDAERDYATVGSQVGPQTGMAAKPTGWNFFGGSGFKGRIYSTGDHSMGRYLLLWLLGVPIPILILIWAFGGLH
jgi:hypothetical protein